MRHLSTALAALAALLLAACGAAAPTSPAVTAGDIQIRDAWARPVQVAMADMGGMDATKPMTETMDMGGPVSGAYMVIRNTGGSPDRLVSAAGDVARSVELHTMVESNGVMQMRPVEGGIPIPAASEVALRPGSFHVMLIGVTRDLKEGDSVPLTLTFERAGTVVVQATVRRP